MPVHSVATVLQNVDGNYLIAGMASFAALGLLKIRSGGRKTTWEREWAGKMILIVAPPSPVILRLIHHLLQLPSPPQILFLPPYPSPLPDSVVTMVQTLRLGITNPLAQLHCEPLPMTPEGVREFSAKWGRVSTGMTGEGGRRIDAVIFGSGWEVDPQGLYEPVPEATTGPTAASSSESSSSASGSSTSTSTANGANGNNRAERRKGKAAASSPTPSDGTGASAGKTWTIHEYHFHILTSLLPSLIRQPPERNIRIIQLISPTYSSALPTLLGKPQVLGSRVQITGAKSITFLLLWKQFQLIFDTLSAAALNKVKEVPGFGADGEEVTVKKKEEGVQSNVMCLRVIMPWTRDEVMRGTIGVNDSWWKWLLWILLYPLVLLMTPSPGKAIQSLLFALQAPVRYGPLRSASRVALQPEDPSEDKKSTSDGSKNNPTDEALREPRTAAVGNGDVVRNCEVVDLPPVLDDPRLAKITFDALEKEVEEGVKEQAAKSSTQSSKEAKTKK